ncbi:MAG TPA: RDD family protein [Bryobacteraceae bacterium]|nr:RDD family protein [Bryobacteraceae bacterium]
MTCQACQTWNGEENHRCRRCGRRLRLTPTRHVREAYPIAATALAYQPQEAAETEIVPLDASTEQGEQRMLFSAPNEARVIPFDQLTSPAERESIRARASQIARQAPVRSAKAEVSPRRPRRSGEPRENQQQFHFEDAAHTPAPRSPIQCGAPVALPLLRFHAALVDGFMILLALVMFLLLFRFTVGSLPTGKVAYSAYLVCYAGLALAYKLLWCFANTDSFGMKAARLRLVDLDGNRPAQPRRFWRAMSSFLSLGAVGLGLIWAFADADHLAWHDQISSTFPTFTDE